MTTSELVVNDNDEVDEEEESVGEIGLTDFGGVELNIFEECVLQEILLESDMRVFEFSLFSSSSIILRLI